VNTGYAASFLDLCNSRSELGIADVLEDDLAGGCGILWDNTEGVVQA
jgi:hypothetical protein